jgi:processing peptidase subunit beta
MSEWLLPVRASWIGLTRRCFAFQRLGSVRYAHTGSGSSVSSHSTAAAMPLPDPLQTSFQPTGLKRLVKQVFGENAAPLPPGYRVEPRLLTQTPTHVTTLTNGMRVATERLDTPTVTVGLWLDTGTRFEPAAVNGAAHFLEHIIFKGTQRRTQQQLEMEVEDMGAQLNAYTSREQTVYFARCLSDVLPQSVDLLADIIQNSRLDAAAVEREKDVILREMEDIESQPEEVVFDYLHGTAFQGTPLSRTILGPVENIQGMQREALLEYIRRHYRPHRMVLVAAGGCPEHERFVELAEKHFGSMPRAEDESVSSETLAAAEPAYFTGSDVRVRNDDMQLAHFALAFETCGWAHPDAPALMVMQALMGAYDRNAALSRFSSSRLCRGLHNVPNAVSAQAFNTSYVDTGLFGVYAIAHPPDLDDVVYEIQMQLTGMAYKLDESEVERAKRQLKTSLLLQLSDSNAVAEDIGRQLLTYNRRVPLAETFARIDAVTAESLIHIANKYLCDRELAVASLGPIASLPDLLWMRRRTYWLRY